MSGGLRLSDRLEIEIEIDAVVPVVAEKQDHGAGNAGKAEQERQNIES